MKKSKCDRWLLMVDMKNILIVLRKKQLGFTDLETMNLRENFTHNRFCHTLYFLRDHEYIAKSLGFRGKWRITERGIKLLEALI